MADIQKQIQDEQSKTEDCLATCKGVLSHKAQGVSSLAPFVEPVCKRTVTTHKKKVYCASWDSDSLHICTAGQVRRSRLGGIGVLPPVPYRSYRYRPPIFWGGRSSSRGGCQGHHCQSIAWPPPNSVHLQRRYPDVRPCGSQEGNVVITNASTNVIVSKPIKSSFVMQCAITTLQGETRLVACGGMHNVVELHRVTDGTPKQVKTFEGHNGYSAPSPNTLPPRTPRGVSFPL